MTLFLCLLIFLPKIFCGFALIHGLWKDADGSSIVLKIGLGIPIGLAVSSSLFFIATLTGLAPNAYSLIEFWGFLIVTIGILWYLIPQLRKDWKFIKPSRGDYFSSFILLIGLGLLLYAFLHYAKMHPYGFEDAWSIWNYSARYIYRTNSLAILLNHQHYESFHPDYPVGLGLNVAWGWFVLNRESTSLPIAIAFYVLIAPALLFWGSLKQWRGRLPATLATLLYLMNPNLKWAVGQLADGLLALCMLSAIIMLYGYLRLSRPEFLFVAALLAGFSAWIKNEGLLFICVFLVIVAILIFRRTISRSTIKWLAGGISAPLLIVAIYKMVIQAPSDLFSASHSATAQLLDGQRWWTIGREFSTYTLDYGNWPVSIVLVLMIYTVLMGFDSSERQRQIWLLLIILGQLVGYFFIYLITPHDLTWHISTSMDRVISHLFPMLIFWLFVALKPPQLA